MAEFYQTEYGQFITSLRPVGRVNATLLEAEQPAGDWSDASTPDLTVCQLVTEAVPISLDLGAGQFSGPMAQRDFIVVPPGMPTRILVDAPHSLRLLATPWQRMLAWANSDHLHLPADGDFGMLHRTYNHNQHLTQSLDALWRQDHGETAAGTLFADALMLQVLASLLDMARPARARPVAGLTRRNLQHVGAFMRTRLAEDIGLEELAALTGLSVAHFCRAFKRSTGRSPYQVLIDLRMQHAQQLLCAPAMTIAEVALACGYSQPAHFAKLFRRTTGVTPSEWRRQRLS